VVSQLIKPASDDNASWTTVNQVSPPFGIVHRARRKVRRWGNELRSIYEERRKVAGADAWPVWVNLNHTSICNLRCIMCEQALGSVPQLVMDRDVYHRVRDEFFERASEISLTVMGDPFCAPRSFIDEIFDDVDRFDLRLEITTNATLLGNDEQIERLARLTSKLVISIDGSTKDTFERIRVPAKWDATVGNIERLAAIRRKLPPHQRPLIFLNYCMMQSNLEEFPLMVDHARRWGAYAVMGLPLHSMHPTMEDETIDVEDPKVLSVIEEAARRAARYGIILRIVGTTISTVSSRRDWPTIPRARALQRWKLLLRPTLALGMNYLARKAFQGVRRVPRECDFLWNKVYVTREGGVSTCCHPESYYMGSLEDRSFREIWNGKRFQGLRRTLNTDHPAAACKDCYLMAR
jgi:radical SAM protein with 4Fe4S-binding SPASM domain